MALTPPTYFDLDNIIVMDIETDALQDYTTIHCIVASDLQGNETIIEQPLEDEDEARKLFSLLERGSQGTVAGHHFLGYDFDVLETFFPGLLPIGNVLDTLVVSKLLNYGIKGGHSIESWGPRVGHKKAHAGLTDFSTYTPDMLERCISDVRVNVKLLRDKLMKYLVQPEWHYSVWLEHMVARSCREMHKNGLYFNTGKAEALHTTLSEYLAPIDEALNKDFPPKKEHIRTFTPRTTQRGTINAQDFRWLSTRSVIEDYINDTGRHITLGDRIHIDTVDLSGFDYTPVHLYELEPFNPGSVRQIVERMNEAGWKPTEKTKGHIDAIKSKDTDKLEHYAEFGWKVSEENLRTLPETAPNSAKALAERIVINSRLSDLEEWLVLVGSEGKMHPQFNGIGAWTHRLSHSKPNSANIPVAKRGDKDTVFETFVNDTNDEMRSLFYAPPGYRLVGTDADGIQMRIFAHIVGDQRLIDSLIKGSKEDGTDIHTLHKGFLGPVCKSRDTAKTFIYAFLLGARVGKVSEILQCTFGQAKTAVGNFLEAYPGLKELKEKQIPRDAERGYFIGLDGRKVACDSEHLMLSGYLQNGEKVIMAVAEQIWRRKAAEAGIPYMLINWVHDEWQSLVEDDDTVCTKFQQLQVDSFLEAGKLLGMRCPLVGSSDWGYTWKDTH